MKEKEEFIRLMSCAFCGKDTGLAIDKKLGKTLAFNSPKNLTKDGKILDMAGCDECKNRFKNHHKYFISDCGHSGFITYSGMEKIFKNGKKIIKEMDKNNNTIFRLEKCPVCAGFIKKEDIIKL